ncbi:MAG: hypothetical protein ABR534_04385 [Desulfotignum sp.]|nr:hypothetical protein [Desulfobacteraceae bacterium]
MFTNENIEVEYQRTDVLGMEFETTLSGFGIRGEAAWYESVPTCFTGMMTPGWADSTMTVSFLWIFHIIFRPVRYKMVE